MINEIKRADQGIIEFLLIDLDIALTLLDVAETSEFRDTAERNHKNAKTAYDTVVAKLPDVSPTPVQDELLREKISLLQARLRAVGQL